MAKLSNKEDRQMSKNAVTSTSNIGNIVKLDEGHNFIVLLDEKFEHGFIHWVHLGDKKYRRVCRGLLDGGGWVPDECELCALASELFDLKKEAKAEGDKVLADEYNKRGNNLRAGYSAVFKAIKFKAIIERKKTKSGVVKQYFPDFDEREIGKLILTHSQTKKLLALCERDEETGEFPFSFIEDGEDMINRPLDFIKKKEPKRLYAELIEIRPDKDIYEFDVDESEIPDISAEFEFIDDLDKIAALYKGEVEENEEEEYEEQELRKKPSRGKTASRKK